MKEDMTIKEFMEELMKTSPFGAMSALSKLVELESIENWLNAMYGISLDIKVKPVEPSEGRHYGKGMIERLQEKPKL